MVAAFRTFVEKVFLPGVKRGDPQLNEWNKINQYFNSGYIPYEELMQYVESINLHPASHGSVTSFEKRELPAAFKKRNEEAFHSNG